MNSRGHFCPREFTKNVHENSSQKCPRKFTQVGEFTHFDKKCPQDVIVHEMSPSHLTCDLSQAENKITVVTC